MSNYILGIVFFLSFSFSSLGQSNLDFEQLDDAVVVILVYDFKGNQFAYGSGFFIDSKGILVTNYHVVAEAYSIQVATLINNKKEIFDIEKIISGDIDKDIVKIEIKNTENRKFPVLKISNQLPKKGQDCWAIGTPNSIDYMNTISRGLISNIDIESSPKILQINAEITHGSSGGALINSLGYIVGITSGGNESQDGARASINFAIWIGEIENLKLIGTKNLLNENNIPSIVTFYISKENPSEFVLYVDEFPVGQFESKFSYIPECMEEGSLWLNQIIPGKHSFVIYDIIKEESYSGTFSVGAKECKVIKVDNEENHEKVTICHMISNSVSETLEIPINEWPMHSSHGDIKGPCSIKDKSNESRESASTSNSQNDINNGLLEIKNKKRIDIVVKGVKVRN